MRDDGSGVVSVALVLDADAVKSAEAGGGKLEDRVRVADLTPSGWTVRPWVRADDGSAVLRLSKPFADPAEATAILSEVSGTVGPLRDMHVTRDRGAVSTKYAVTGTIDLAKLGTGVTSDEQLVQSLQGQHVDVATIDRSLQSAAADALSLKVVADLPGARTTVAGKPGSVTTVDASSSRLDTTRVGLVLLAILLVVGAVLVLVWPGRRRRRGSRRGRGRGEQAGGEPGPAVPPPARRPPDRRRVSPAAPPGVPPRATRGSPPAS